MWAKVRDNNTCSVPLIWKNLDIHWGIGIDIFPLVGSYQNKLLNKLQKKLHRVCRLLLAKDLLVATDSKELKNWKLRLLYRMPRLLRIGICRLLELYTFRRFDNSKNATTAFWHIDHLFNTKAYGTGVMKKFEDREYRIPENYDHILTQLYGDYMTPPPESERNGHEGSLGKIIYDCEKSYKEYLASN